MPMLDYLVRKSEYIYYYLETEFQPLLLMRRRSWKSANCWHLLISAKPAKFGKRWNEEQFWCLLPNNADRYTAKTFKEFLLSSLSFLGESDGEISSMTETSYVWQICSKLSASDTLLTRVNIISFISAFLEESDGKISWNFSCQPDVICSNLPPSDTLQE